jgi:hypothetical protein
MYAHLAEYKRSVLNVAADGIWSRTGKPYAHILPTAVREWNIVEAIRTDCFAHERIRSVKLHRDFHHLNSSQAFAFNLFFPLLGIPEAPPHVLLAALGFPGQALVDWRFEAVPVPEEGTNFDLMLHLTDARVHVEVKLTEREFGIARGSALQLAKRENFYLQRLRGKVDPALLQPDQFFRNYQLLRNMSYASESGDHVLFVLPHANAGLATTAERFVSQQIAQTLRPFVRVVYAEKLIDTIQGAELHPRVALALQQVATKYRMERSAMDTAASA